ncbi:MAG: ROK family transcriptional regulator, partial [Thermotogae bacterium]
MVKERNTTIILDLLMNDKFSRAELSRATGLTRSTVGEIIREMLDLGIVQE